MRNLSDAARSMRALAFGLFVKLTIAGNQRRELTNIYVSRTPCGCCQNLS